MKRNFTRFMMLATMVVGAASCSESVDDAAMELRDNAVLYVEDIASSTRVSFEDRDAQGITPSWELEDMFTLYDAEGVRVGNFECTSTDESKFVATTPGLTLKEDDAYTAIYPASAEATLEAAKSSIDPSVQSGDQIDNLDSSLYMLSEFTYSAESNTIEFEHQMAIMTFKFASEVKPAKLVFSCGADSYTVNYSAIEPVNGIYTSHIMINPQEAESRSLLFSLYEAGATEPYDERATTTEKAYLAGGRYTASVNDYEEATLCTLADFSADSYPTDSDNWTITDAVASTEDFGGLRDAMGALESSEREISLSFPNLKEFPDDALNNGLMRALKSISANVATTIGNNVFYTCNSLTTISLPEVTTVGMMAFANSQELTCLSLPKVEIFDWEWVLRSNKISEITIKNKTYSAENGVFYNTDKSILYKYIGVEGVTEFTAPESVKTIEDFAFNLNCNLKSISLPKATTIGEGSFENCESLESISLPEVTTIGIYSFYSCYKLPSISLPKVTNLTYPIFGFCNDLNSISLPKVTEISIRAFLFLPNLTNLEIATESKLTCVSDDIFNNTPTENIDLVIGTENEGVDTEAKTWNSYTFKSITTDKDTSEGDKPTTSTFSTLADFSAENYPTDSDNWTITDAVASTEDFGGLRDAMGALKSSNREISLSFPNLKEFPDNALKGEYGSFNMNALISVSADLATTIGNNAFYNCEKIATISMPKVVSVGDSAFNLCYLLNEVSLPEAITIEAYAFSLCLNMTSISLPKATTIKPYSISSCDSLTEISLPEATTIEDGAFYSCQELTNLSIPKIDAFDWQWVGGCNKILEIVTKNETFTAEDGAFYNTDKSILYKYIGVEGVTEFTAPESVIEVGKSAFYENKTLTTLSLPNVTTIGDNACFDCSVLKSVSLPEVITIGSNSFRGCDQLTSISLPKATTIRSLAFAFCNILSNISIPKVIDLQNSVLANLENLTRLEVATESKLAFIYSYMFNGTPTENIDLVIGSENEGVDTEAKTWNGYTFKSITIR